MAGEIVASRRSFIGGLAALIAAPALVKASSLMPIKVVHFERFLADYCINTDEIILRGDKAQFELPVPRFAKLLTRVDVEKVSPEFLRRFNSLRPEAGQQLSINFVREHYSSDHGWLI